MAASLENSNPVIHSTTISQRPLSLEDLDDSIDDEVDALEIYDLIKNINDPEHPLTLEQLNVVNLEHLSVSDNRITIEFTPTIPHCSMATLIGLCIRVKLYRSLSYRWKIIVRIREGTHQSEKAVNKQLADKERVAAALENGHLLEVVNQCLSRSI